MFTQAELKMHAAQAALSEVLPLLTPDTILGIGTGSTADLFIDALAAHRHQFLGAVASSERSASRLSQHGIKVFDLNEVDSIPVYIDGADEINADLVMIKGGGGALTREKIVASVAKQFICIADDSKLVSTLGAFPLPLEVLPLARVSVERFVRGLGADPVLRQGFITDNGNLILDVHGLTIKHPLELEQTLSAYPGVVTSGIFAKQSANLALLAGANGVVRLGKLD